jgi:hypothetical protein
MSGRIPQATSDLEKHLADQLRFLESSAAAFDSGFDGEARRLAVVIRVLVHDTKQSKSLLGLLGRKGMGFYDSALDVNPNNLMTHSGLTAMRLTAGGPDAGGKYIALLDGAMAPHRPITFDQWWNKVVIVDDKRHTITRKELVLAVANTDGGAHVDPTLDEKYARLSRGNSLAWIWHDESGERPMEGPELAAVRQIAHEVLKSFQKPSKPASVVQPTLTPTVRAPNPFQAGRNDPCPCGSGKKFKKCHGA